MVDEGRQRHLPATIAQPADQRREILERPARLAGDHRRWLAGHREQAPAGARLVQPRQGRGPDAADRCLDGAPEGDVVGPINREAHVGERVLDFFTLVKPDAPDDPVGHARAAPRVPRYSCSKSSMFRMWAPRQRYTEL